MKRLLAPLGLTFSLIAGCVGLLAQQNATLQLGPITNTISAPSNVTVQLSGQNSCSVTTSGPATFSYQPRSSNDQQNWTNIGSAVVSTGTATVAINAATQGIAYFQANFTAVSGGPLTYTIVCNLSGGGGSGSSGGGNVVITGLTSPIPFPVTTPPPPVFPSPYPTNGVGQIETASVLDSTGLPVIPQICDKNVVSANIVTATTTTILAVSGSNKYFICGWQVTNTGSNATNTFQLEYGTGATCGTGTTVFTAVLTPGSTANTNTPAALAVLYPFAFVVTPAAGAACIVTTGTTNAIQVMLVYAIHT